MSLEQLLRLTPNQAYFALEHIRWVGKPECPYCECARKIWEHPDDKRRAPRFQCGACRRSFGVTIGTMFHNSQLPLRTWLVAIGNLAQNPGMSATEFAELVGINRRATAARMHLKIRSAYVQGGLDKQLIDGLIELFELENRILEEFDAV